jgi:hypothetical protein
MRSPVRLVRNTEANRLFDMFLLTAVLTILVTRLYLEATGFPQIGGSALHIAHLLPGGFLMMAAILVVIGSINRSARDVAAFIGGIGFGLFLDELGKFITRDNDYFFRPTIGLIYIAFIVLYLITRYALRRTYHSHDYLANALDLATDGVIGDLDPREYQRAHQLLRKADPSHPMYDAVVDLLDSAKPTKDYQPFIVDRLIDLVHRPFKQLVAMPAFRKALLWLFALFGGVLLLGGVVAAKSLSRTSLEHLLQHPLSASSALIVAVASSAILLWWGLWLLRQQRINDALRKFETALLITIFVTQVFLFFSYQLPAIVGLLIALPLLFAVRMLLAETR